MSFRPTPGNTFTPLSGILMQTLQKAADNAKDNSGSVSPSYSPESSDDDSENDYYPPGEIGTKYLKEAGIPSLKFYTPFYWNGVRWADVGSMRLARKYHKKEFTVISWNVWFGLRNRESRMDALGKTVREYDPDFIGFQEVTREILPLILQQQWAKDYFVSDPEGKILETYHYGNVMLSKVSFHEFAVHKLESNMGRKAMLGNFLIEKSSPVTFGTFHLESNKEDAAYRANQLKVFRELTKTCPNVILMGDTNFSSDSEVDSLGDRFKDAWRELYQKTPEDMVKNLGLTFDTETNDMAKEEYKLQQIENPKRVRLDRCFYSHETVEPIAMKILGDTPYEGREYISDHYGIVVKLRLKN